MLNTVEHIPKTDITITILIEDTTHTRGVKAEHGLSVLIDKSGRKILCDTGQSEVLGENAKESGVRISDIDAVFLSHGHYDHTGGLNYVLQTSSAPVYGHPDIFVHRYILPDSRGGRETSAREIGIPFSKSFFEKKGLLSRIHLNRKSITVGDFTLTGESPKITDFEMPFPRFFRDAQGKEIDTISDDQSLFTSTPNGLVVFLGCCHSGIINTLMHIIDITGQTRFYWIIGGAHLIHSSEERLDKTVRALNKLDFRYITPILCTGLHAQCFLHSCFQDRFVLLSCGDRQQL